MTRKEQFGCYNLRFGCHNQKVWLNIAQPKIWLWQPKLMHRTSFGAVAIHIVVASQSFMILYHFKFGNENHDFSL